MSKLDPKLTEQIQIWLNSEHASDEMIVQGAQLLLRLNGNRHLHANILRKPSNPRWKDRLEVELNKYLKIRLEGLTRQEVAEMDARVVKQAEEILDEPKKPQTKGRRADHDKLPNNVQQLFTSCAGIYKKIRALHTQLRSMNDMKSCDRYEYLKQLDDLDDMYRSRMRQYDEFVLSKNTQQKSEDDLVFSNERSYLKRYKVRLKKAYEERTLSEKHMQAYEDMLTEGVPHINYILKHGKITEKVRGPLREYGFRFPDEQNS